MRSLTLRSPAKLNLFLKVIRKRPDGYHDLETLFERINLCDTISLKLHKKDEIRVSCPGVTLPKGNGNLAYRAADFLKKKYKITEGIEIILNKKIPVAAGLGGGSSNAATVLKGLDQLWDLSLTESDLMSIGRVLGSDVPFFINDVKWAIGTEKGDVLKPICFRLKLWHILVVPRIKMYSREVFTRLNLQLTKADDDVNILSRALYNKDINKVSKALCNDLEPSILGISPKLLKVKTAVAKATQLGVSFSGSGPALFGIMKSRKEAQAAYEKLSKVYSRVFVVATF